MPTRLQLWGALLLVAGLWELGCRYTSYDWRRSAALNCTVLRTARQGECYSGSSQFCLPASVVGVLSPRWLSNSVGMGGPLISWVPLLAFAQCERPAARRLAALSRMHRTLVWYLGGIGVVRHAHVLSTVRWDPSGHVFVYGAQLVPLWRLLPAAPTPGAQWPVLEALLGAWTAVLWYLSFTTASFFHTLSETAAGYALVLLLALALRPESSARTGPAPCTLAALLWLSFTAVGFASRVGGSVRASLLELGYDAALWATLAAISTRLPRRGDVAGGQTELTE